MTSRRLGRRLGMHLFRHCAATSLALEASEHVRQIPALLGHRRLATSERYYNLAEASTAAASYQNGLLALRRRLQEEARPPQRRG
jgi:integrase/recombinase XerD